MQLLGFEGLDIFKSIYNPTADLEKVRPLVEPPPTLERARTEAPAACQLHLIEMSKIRRARSRPAGVLGCLSSQMRCSACARTIANARGN